MRVSSGGDSNFNWAYKLQLARNIDGPINAGIYLHQKGTTVLDSYCICTLARRSARSLTEIYDRALEPSGLKVTQYSLLRAIQRLGAPSLTELSEGTGLDRSTLGRNLRLLENSGHVTIDQGEDARTRIAQLTADAENALQIARPLWEKAQQNVSASVPKGAEEFFINLNTRLEEVL